ncbi:MAG: hypothetical protein AB1635_18125 [Acidobacteriota bacterium]
MAKIVVNDVERGAADRPQTWGDLLSELDAQLAPDGQIVTAARFDGVDEPSFRDDALTRRMLAEWAVVEITSEAPRDLLSSCLADVEGNLASMREAVLKLGDVFRGPRLGVANDGLAHVAEDLRALVSLTEMLSGPLGVELHALKTQGQTVDGHLYELGRLLEQLVEAQQGGDWLTVADILEFDLEPALANWQAIFSTLRSHLAAAAPARAESAS